MGERQARGSAPSTQRIRSKSWESIGRTGSLIARKASTHVSKARFARTYSALRGQLPPLWWKPPNRRWTKLKQQKSGQGEGTFRKRADGRWEARLRVGTQDGKRRRISVYGRTRAEVRDRLAKLQHDRARSLPVSTVKHSLAEF